MTSFSLIIPIYNRPDELAALLESLSGQSYSKDLFEVIVVDDGSEENITIVLDEIEKKHEINLRYFRQNNQGPGIARNTGMEQARNDVIVFIDSDCIVPSHYLKEVDEAFNELGMDAYGGPDTAMDTFSVWDKAVNYVMTSFLTTGGLRGAGRTLARFYPRSFNMGFKKEIYRKIGGFGSIFQYGEDIEFSHRILKATSEVAFLPEAYVYHKRRSSIKAFVRQIFRMGKARIQLARIDKKLLEPLYLVPALALVVLAALLIGSLFSAIAANALLLFLGAGLLWLLILTVHGLIKTRSAATALLVPVAFTLQMVAYGSGILTESVRQLFGRK